MAGEPNNVLPLQVEARPSRYSSLGKCDAELKTHVPEEIKAEWAAKAARIGTTPGALLCDLVIMNLRGADFLKSLLDARLSVLGHNAPDCGPETRP
jgi:hypothetical protein